MDLYKTKDGSNTLFHAEFDEHYHSIHGALQESMHVFIQNGLALHPQKKELDVFEMGFGTGLNTLLAYNYAEENQVKIHYYSIEAYPITLAQAESLAYEKFGIESTTFKTLHELDWGSTHQVSEYFNLHKIQGFLEKTNLDTLAKMNVIFYDAFAPSAQEHLWETTILQKMNDLLLPGGHLTTYCAKGQFKRNLKAVGFDVKGVPGPPGKREMTLALKPS